MSSENGTQKDWFDWAKSLVADCKVRKTERHGEPKEFARRIVPAALVGDDFVFRERELLTIDHDAPWQVRPKHHHKYASRNETLVTRIVVFARRGPAVRTRLSPSGDYRINCFSR